jgi:HAD superfamily hydrolase (TIGR01509 family)
VLVLPVSGDLSGKRGAVTVVAWRDELQAITFDFGNTLVAVDRASLRRVVEVTAAAVVGRLGPFDVESFLAAWAEERERQFREEVPRFREVDLAERFARVLARLRGFRPPGPDEPWDQTVAAGMSTPTEIEWAVDTYSFAFVDALPPPPGVEPLLGRLAQSYRLAILSNWPLAATIDRYADAAGWTPHLAAVVVSQRVGTIKPHPRMFVAAANALGDPPAATILHVGDDWVADVVGAARAGWRTAYLNVRPADSPLPSSIRDRSVVPDLELADLADLEARIGP